MLSEGTNPQRPSPDLNTNGATPKAAAEMQTAYTCLPNARKRSLMFNMQEEEEAAEKEIASAMPMRLMKRRRVKNKRPGGLRIAYAQVENGTMTPVTETEAASQTSASMDSGPIERWNGRYRLVSGISDSTDSDCLSVDTPLARPGKSWRAVSEEEVSRARSRRAWVSAAGPAYPLWLHQSWRAPAASIEEHRAVSALQREFLEAYPAADRPEYTYSTLDGFTIYRPPQSTTHAYELVTLEKLTQLGKGEFYLAGVLFLQGRSFFVKDVPFDILTLEYGVSRPWHDRICIQSKLAKARDVYYKLGRPSQEYERFYTPFLAVAQFTDYFIDYLEEHNGVTIADFRSDFWAWLLVEHGGDPSFHAWHRRIKLQDFRTHVAVYVEFLWKECWDIDQHSARTAERTKLCKHPIWRETHPERLDAIPAQLVNYTRTTVVTPFAYSCFSSIYFADMLGVHTIAEDALRQRVANLKIDLGLAPLRTEIVTRPIVRYRIQPLEKVSDLGMGDVVVVPADKTGSWKLSTADLWYAYVQRIWRDRQGSRRLDVIWLYQPEDTTIGNAFYPYSNELFLSDNCGCGKKEALYLDDVNDIVGKVNVSWFVEDAMAQKCFFVRRVFRTVPELDRYDFVKLESHHFRCCCNQEDHINTSTINYKAGDAVLVRKKQDATGRNCHAAVVVGFTPDGDRVRLRKLLYASEASDQRARPNELVITSEEFERHEDDIVRLCQVRCFTREQLHDGLPTPYDRDGAGDYFYIVQNQSGNDLPVLNQSWDPREPDTTPKLTGLGIFCGGGSFDRGLEEGGAVQFQYAVDIAEKALHSYWANDPHPDRTKYYLGSVNEYLACAMAGKGCEAVAEPGAIQVISAGSPCQGFSMMQQDKNSDRSRRNASMVASVISFVDLYAPRYLILENVVAMARNLKNGQNVFSYMTAALVGLGYQVQQFLMDANYQGSSQGRSRVFIIATAPACTVLDQPEYTHAKPAHLDVNRHLGKCSNGKHFGSRRENPFVPFSQVSAEDSIEDLPGIHDGQPFLCPSHPDHRRATEETASIRDRIASVPKRPFGMSLVQAAQKGLVRGQSLEYCNGSNKIKCGPTSRAYQRVHPDRSFPTMITKLAVGDGIHGRVVHWSQDRVLTIMEARRAQGYPDHEVLIGTPPERMKVVGNSVDRKVALVLGLALRQSWLQSPVVAESGVSAVDAMPNQAESAAPADDTDKSGDMSVRSSPIDNRTVKMSLNLSRADIAQIRKEGFKRINALLALPDHCAARRSLHGRSNASTTANNKT